MIRRREFITLLGGVAAWPLAARAQQSAMPVVGFLDTRSSDGMTSRLASFRQGLKEVGIVEGENVMVIYRWAEDRVDRLPDMARELAQQATVIVTTGGPPSAFAAKEATTKIPIVFLVGDDPVRLGLVSSLARPGGNLTGINMLANELEAKRLQLLHQLVPQFREFADAGGLVSYGIDPADVYRQVGVYAGRVLKGAKPAELPVMQASKFEFVINLKTAKTLGLDVPLGLTAAADEVIE